MTTCSAFRERYREDNSLYSYLACSMNYTWYTVCFNFQVSALLYHHSIMCCVYCNGQKIIIKIHFVTSEKKEREKEMANVKPADSVQPIKYEGWDSLMNASENYSAHTHYMCSEWSIQRTASNDHSHCTVSYTLCLPDIFYSFSSIWGGVSAWSSLQCVACGWRCESRLWITKWREDWELRERLSDEKMILPAR